MSWLVKFQNLTHIKLNQIFLFIKFLLMMHRSRWGGESRSFIPMSSRKKRVEKINEYGCLVETVGNSDGINDLAAPSTPLVSWLRALIGSLSKLRGGRTHGARHSDSECESCEICSLEQPDESETSVLCTHSHLVISSVGTSVLSTVIANSP